MPLLLLKMKLMQEKATHSWLQMSQKDVPLLAVANFVLLVTGVKKLHLK